MTPDQIEDMRRDMEAGTPGPWRIGSHDPQRGIWVGGSDENGAGVLPYLWFGHTINFPKHYEANARRIARVPQLEAEVLRLRGLLQRIEPNIGSRGKPDDDLEGDLFHCEFCGASAAIMGDIPHHDECLVFLVRAALKGTDQ